MRASDLAEPSHTGELASLASRPTSERACPTRRPSANSEGDPARSGRSAAPGSQRREPHLAVVKREAGICLPERRDSGPACVGQRSMCFDQRKRKRTHVRTVRAR